MYEDQHIQTVKLASYEETAGKTDHEQFQIPVSHSSTPVSGSHSHMPGLLMFALNSGIPILVEGRILQYSCLQERKAFSAQENGVSDMASGTKICSYLDWNESAVCPSAVGGGLEIGEQEAVQAKC